MAFLNIPTKTATRAYTASTICFALVIICSAFCLCIECDAKKWLALNIFIVTLAITPLIVFRFAVEESYKEQIKTLHEQHNEEVSSFFVFIKLRLLYFKNHMMIAKKTYLWKREQFRISYTCTPTLDPHTTR